MAFPSGARTRIVRLGTAFSLEGGVSLGIKATIKATRGLVYAPAGVDGQSAVQLGTDLSAAPGMLAEATIPVTDQAATWQDGAGNFLSVDGGAQTHYYTISGTFLDAAGKAIPGAAGEIKLGPIAIPTGTEPIDLDLMIPVTSTAGVTVSVPDVWSAQVAAAQAAVSEMAANLDSAEAAFDTLIGGATIDGGNP